MADSSMQPRFVESEATGHLRLDSMLGEILVVCPQCQAVARIAPVGAETVASFTPRRLICEKCGLVKEWAGRSLRYPGGEAPTLDPYFRLPLWLSTACCGHVLWFFNRQHMQLIEQYVRAGLRERGRHPKYGWNNQGLFNRLPKFIKEAKHRDEILKAIEKLHHKG